jgi:alkanesulfonate monooxygenase SsuD/methylene tetrahydromethanopterin reductase-like flavin-dependent oxidoreductase (luciferase family)
MEIGIGLDASLGLTFPEHRAIAREAAGLGYESAWTPSGLGPAEFQVCGQWSAATQDLIPGGIGTAISVVPVPIWNPVSLAVQAASLSLVTNGKFALGIGNGRSHNSRYRQTFGVPDLPPVGMMREWLTVLRGLMDAERVIHDGRAIKLDGAKIGFSAPRVPLFVGALGAQMVRLSGELADGVAPNWCTPEKIAWTREIIAEGAKKAGRSPDACKVFEYIRISVDDDIDVARRALARAVMPYALAEPGAPKSMGYRGHFAQMGFDAAINEIEDMRENGATEEAIIDAFPPDMLNTVGYFGKADGAAVAFARLAKGLDRAVVRVVAARPGAASVRAVMHACAPSLVRAA